MVDSITKNSELKDHEIADHDHIDAPNAFDRNNLDIERHQLISTVSRDRSHSQNG